MKQLFFLLSGFISLSSYAQTVIANEPSGEFKGSNNYILSSTFSLYFQQLNIDNSNNAHLSAKNTFGYDISVEYNRITRKKLLFGFGLDYGHQSHRITIDHNLADFDPQAKQSLQNSNYSYTFNTNIQYIAPKLLIGYAYQFSKNVQLVSKLGVRRTLYLNGDRCYILLAEANYMLDDGVTQKTSKFNYANWYFGNDPEAPKAKLIPWNSWNDNWEFYLGASKKVKSFWISSVEIGFNAKYTLGKIATPSFTDNYLTSSESTAYKQSYYFERNLAIGLVLGIGF